MKTILPKNDKFISLKNEPGKRKSAFRVPVQKKKKRKISPSSLAEKLITGGILATALAIAVSLFIYFRPFTWEDVINAAKTFQSFAAAQITQLQKWHASMTEKPEPTTAPEETVPYINRSDGLGEVSDFTAEPVFLYEEESIFAFMLNTEIGPMLYYCQGDIRWKDYLYGGSDPMGRYGCGPTCVAMIINSFSPTSVSPVEMAEWSAANNGYALHGGSYHRLIPDSLSAFGLQVESVTDHSVENVSNLLDTGHILVALMGKGSLTQNGHFIIIVQLCENGNVYIADPANYENCAKQWDLQQLMDELKDSYDSGGPLWAVSLSAKE